MTDAPPAPVWRRIAQSLASDIGPNGLRPGARLPIETDLAARFGVNRHTVRRALDHLVRAGQVRTERGRGTFVAEDLIAYPVIARTRFNEWIRKQNREPSGQVLHVREAAATVHVADGLGVGVGSPIAWLERLGFANGTPISLGSHYFASARLPGILEALRASETITAALQAVGIPDYVRRSTQVSARMPTAVEADLLQVSRSRPVLVCDNLNADADGSIIEFGVTRYPSTRVQVVFEP